MTQITKENLIDYDIDYFTDDSIKSTNSELDFILNDSDYLSDDVDSFITNVFKPRKIKNIIKLIDEENDSVLSLDDLAEDEYSEESLHGQEYIVVNKRHVSAFQNNSYKTLDRTSYKPVKLTENVLKRLQLEVEENIYSTEIKDNLPARSKRVINQINSTEEYNFHPSYRKKVAMQDHFKPAERYKLKELRKSINEEIFTKELQKGIESKVNNIIKRFKQTKSIEETKEDMNKQLKLPTIEQYEQTREKDQEVCEYRVSKRELNMLWDSDSNDSTDLTINSSNVLDADEEEELAIQTAQEIKEYQDKINNVPKHSCTIRLHSDLFVCVECGLEYGYGPGDDNEFKKHNKAHYGDYKRESYQNKLIEQIRGIDIVYKRKINYSDWFLLNLYKQIPEYCNWTDIYKGYRKVLNEKIFLGFATLVGMNIDLEFEDLQKINYINGITDDLYKEFNWVCRASRNKGINNNTKLNFWYLLYKFIQLRNGDNRWVPVRQGDRKIKVYEKRWKEICGRENYRWLTMPKVVVRVKTPTGKDALMLNYKIERYYWDKQSRLELINKCINETHTS